MPSYQEIETAVKTLERKVDFILRSIPIAKKVPSLDPSLPGYRIEQKTLLDLYYELQAVGGTLVLEPTVGADQEADRG